jgi:hypothetical protein
VDPDQRQTIRVLILLDDLVGDPDERPPEIVVIEHDLVVVQLLRTFLASPDRVKGACRASVAA